MDSATALDLYQVNKIVIIGPFFLHETVHSTMEHIESMGIKSIVAPATTLLAIPKGKMIIR